MWKYSKIPTFVLQKSEKKFGLAFIVIYLCIHENGPRETA